MWIMVGDLHLTDKARDDYRFGIFEWIKRQQAKRDVAATFLAGDLTENKDRHSATLVNKIVSGLTTLQPPIYICKGNHDYRDPANPFFKFLNQIPGITFISEPTVCKTPNPVAVIPHCHMEQEFSVAVRENSGADALVVHQTFNGAIAESGVKLSGFPIPQVKVPVYAGDVHRPQKQGIVTYLGCPYQVRFGDDFNPRSIWVDRNGKTKDLYFDAPYKWSLRVRDSADLYNHRRLAEGDQVKLTIEVSREEVVDWKLIKANLLATCHDLKLEVHGVKMEVEASITPERMQLREHNTTSVFEAFCAHDQVPNTTAKVGKDIMESNNGN